MSANAYVADVETRLLQPPRYPIGTPVRTVLGGACGVICSTPGGDVWCCVQFEPFFDGGESLIGNTSFDNIVPLDRETVVTSPPFRQLELFAASAD